MKEDRGFSNIVGKKIIKVDAESINCVVLYTDDGGVYEVWAEERHCGIEVIELKKSEDK